MRRIPVMKITIKDILKIGGVILAVATPAAYICTWLPVHGSTQAAAGGLSSFLGVVLTLEIMSRKGWL